MIYDVDLTLGLPVPISVTSGVNAIAHAVEALYAQDRNPITSLIAEEGVRALTRALPAIVTTPRGPTARRDALYGASLCGVCLGAAGMALHHKLCHVLGGAFDLPHAETHTVILPHALAYNAPAAPEAAARIAAAMGVEDGARGLYDLIGRLAGPRALRESACPRPASSAPPRSPSNCPTGIRARSSASQSASRSSAPIAARGRRHEREGVQSCCATPASSPWIPRSASCRAARC